MYVPPIMPHLCRLTAKPVTRQLHHLCDMKVFSGGPSNDPASETEGTSASAVPPGFPPHRAVDGAIELGGYLASSAYIVSLGGPPLPDLQYGIIIVQKGKESLLFAGHGNHAAMSPEHKEEVYAKSKAVEEEERREWWRQQLAEGPNADWQKEELDDDEIEFYHRRWLARLGRRAEAGPSQLDDTDAVREYQEEHAAQLGFNTQKALVYTDPSTAASDQHDVRSVVRANSPVTVIPVAEGTVGPSKLQLDDRPEHHESSMPETAKDDGQVGAKPNSNHDAPMALRASGREERALGSPNSEAETETDNRIQPQVLDSPPPSRVPCASEHPQVVANTNNNNSQPRPAPSPLTLRDSISINNRSPLSPEAGQALETLLREETAQRKKQKKKNKGSRVRRDAVVKTLLPRRLGSRTDDSGAGRGLGGQQGHAVPTTRGVLLELAGALTSLARDEVEQNPGIDPRVWKAAGKVLAWEEEV